MSSTRDTRCVGVLALQGDFREHCEMLRGAGHEAHEVNEVTVP